MFKLYKNNTVNNIVKELIEVAKISLFLTVAIILVVFIILIIAIALTFPPFRALIVVFFSVWIVVFLLTYVFYKWKRK